MIRQMVHSKHMHTRPGEVLHSCPGFMDIRGHGGGQKAVPAASHSIFLFVFPDIAVSTAWSNTTPRATATRQVGWLTCNLGMHVTAVRHEPYRSRPVLICNSALVKTGKLRLRKTKSSQAFLISSDFAILQAIMPSIFTHRACDKLDRRPTLLSRYPP